MNTSIQPVVAGVKIRVNSDGLFNINDLHVAAGGLKQHQPSDWLRTQKTAEHADYLRKKHGVEPIRTSANGANKGTFVHENMAYSYAMWVSPGFHDQVIETFKAVLSGNMESALTEAQRAKVAYWQDAKKNGISARDADLMIAHATGDQATIDRMEQEDEEHEEWKANTLPGQVFALLERVGPGYELTYNVPSRFDVEQAKAEVAKILTDKKLSHRIEECGRSLIIETF